MRDKFCFVLAMAFYSSCLGCGGSAKLAAVSGRVTYNGKPVEKADVSFTPVEGASRAATGLTHTDGRFTLGTFGSGDGAFIGKYRVSIVAVGPSRKSKPGETGSGISGDIVPGDPLIPPKYFAPDTSGLTFEVKRGSNWANFELTD